MSVHADALKSPLGELAVIPATVDHARSVLALRDDLAKWMRARGIKQWRPGELPLEWIQWCMPKGGST